MISYRAVPELRRSSWAREELASSVWWWWENENLSTLTLNRFRNIDSVLDKFHIFSRFRSKPFLDPQSSIFNRFWRAGALSPPQTLYLSVIAGQGQSETDKNRLTWPNRVRRPRSNISLRYHAEDPRHENWVKNDYRRLDNGYFWANRVRKVPNAGIEPPNTCKLQKMSDWDQSDDLELLQNNYHGHQEIWDFSQNRIWTHRTQFSTDSGARGLYFRRRHCIRPLLRLTDSQRSIKTVWVDQVGWGDPARTHLWVITRRTL